MQEHSMKECLSKQLFGLPAQHFSYVKNISPGMPLFLFNYSDRKLHGIFEAASNGEMFIDPHGWTVDGSETQFPAQVQISVRLQCQPLSEDIFKPIIAQNYYNRNQFWFELDHGQTGRLICLLSSMVIIPADSVPQSSSNRMATVSDTHMAEEKVKQVRKNETYKKLKEFSITCENQDLSLENHVNTTPDASIEEKGYLEAPVGLKKEESRSPPFVGEYNIAQLVHEVKELMDFKKIQTERNCYLEQKLMEAELEIQHLREVVTQTVQGRQF